MVVIEGPRRQNPDMKGNVLVVVLSGTKMAVLCTSPLASVGEQLLALLCSMYAEYLQPWCLGFLLRYLRDWIMYHERRYKKKKIKMEGDLTV